MLALSAPILALIQAAGDTTPVDQLSDFALWGIVGGALSSVATAVINRSAWPSTVKLAVFFLVCTVVSAGDAYFLRSLDFHHWSRALLIVVASGWASYQAAKPAIKQIEARTG